MCPNDVWSGERRHNRGEEEEGQEHERAARGTTVGLYGRLLEEKEEGERRRGGPLLARRGLDSKVLDRRLGEHPRTARRGTPPTCR